MALEIQTETIAELQAALEAERLAEAAKSVDVPGAADPAKCRARTQSCGVDERCADTRAA